MNPPDLSDGEDAELVNPRERAMGFLDHLEELRWTLVKSAVVFAIFAAGIGFFLQSFNDVLLWPLHSVQADHPTLAIDLGTTSVMEAFSVIIQMCAGGGLILASPLILFFVGQFVSPALTERELKVLLPVCFSAMVLFALGAAFGFFLLVPSTIRVAVEVNEVLGFALRWTPASYYSLLLWLVLGVGAAFEFPLLILLAIYLGFLTVETLRGHRRHAIVVIFIVAAVVTPTPDPVTQAMFAAPLYVLFELSILVGSRLQARRAIR